MGLVQGSLFSCSQGGGIFLTSSGGIVHENIYEEMQAALLCWVGNLGIYIMTYR